MGTEPEPADRCSRRGFLKLAGAAGLGAMATPWLAGLRGQEASRPNIVLIYVDDMGYGDLSCYNDDAWVKTPNLDKLAEGGVRFTQGYVTAPVCYPSRVGLMTGAYQERWGSYHNRPMIKPPEPQKLIPTAMKAAGYTTGMTGKWNGVKGQAEEFFDEAQHVLGWTGQYWPVESGQNRKELPNWGPNEEYETDVLTDHACDFIAGHKDEPFFYYLAYNAPHTPLRAKKEHRDQVAHLHTEPERVYAAMVLAIDEGVGKVMQALEENGLTEDTVVVFVSDNGPARIGSPKGKAHYPNDWPSPQLGSTGPLRGRKKQLGEGGIRMPFIMRYPAAWEQGIADDFIVSTLDLYPTFCALAGVEPPEDTILDGINLVPHLEGKQQGQRKQNLYWAFGGRRPRCGVVRSGEWKLHVTHYKGGNIKSRELFNLAEDIGETENLLKQKPTKAAALLEDYKKWFAKMGPPNTDK